MYLESIKALVQVLVIIIVLAVFLEMLLPSSHMHNYVKIVMGLMVIVVVLEAGANLIQQDFNFELPVLSQSSEGPGLEKIMSDGQKLAGNQKERAITEYKQGLERQVLALVRLQNNLNVTGVKIETASNPQEPDFGRLTGVILEISRDPLDQDPNAVQKIKPVEVTVGTTSPTEQAGNGSASPENTAQAKELARTVANFYNIPVEQVQVVETER